MRSMPRGFADAVMQRSAGLHIFRQRCGRPWAPVILALLLAGSAARSRPASAAVCHLESVPAATLLLPYFEVNLNDPNGLTTLFSVNNASATAVLAHVVLWSDLSVPVLAFTTGGIVYPTLYLLGWASFTGHGSPLLAAMVAVSTLTAWCCYQLWRGRRSLSGWS